MRNIVVPRKLNLQSLNLGFGSAEIVDAAVSKDPAFGQIACLQPAPECGSEVKLSGIGLKAED